MNNKSNDLYGIQMIIRGSDDGWIDFDDAKDKSMLDLRLKWIEHYYPDDTFRRVKYKCDQYGCIDKGDWEIVK